MSTTTANKEKKKENEGKNYLKPTSTLEAVGENVRASFF